MKLGKLIRYSVLILGLSLYSTSCKDYLDVNLDPNAVQDAPIEQLLTTCTVSLGFFGGSDLHRYSSLLAQQFSGQGQGATTQPQEYDRYNIQGSDLNNVWNLLYASILSDLELVIQKADTEKSPHYAGVAKIMKAYVFHLMVDAWGKVPYSEGLKFTANTAPKFDDGEAIYTDLERLLDEAIADLNAPSIKSPAANSTIFPGTFTASRPRWVRLANTIKLRLYLHQSKKSRANTVQKITALVNSASVSFMESNADNFQMAFINEARRQNPIHQFELDRVNQFFPGATLVNLMNQRNDPRRPRYFTPFPFTRDAAPAYAGAKPGDAPSFRYSRMHTYLRGDTTNTTPVAAQADGSITNSAYTYNGTAPIRMLTFAEYNFIRAEAAVYGAPGTAETFFQAGIRASMSGAGVPTAQIDDYIAANGTLTGTEAERVRRIIEEKYIANYGVTMESWTDWRRTGFPQITAPVNALTPFTPRSLFYPQTEIDLNPNAPAQKTDMSERVFWDVQ
ncbi:MAG: SusD/RagB family nutrient-binding outer membrane lipoprotein [Saprospiraceae bacterium]|nr:SusD/RagB family nutrient-binding outer membrane lipoprotein [Saprospiraceae bacterium]HRK80276.1 SusD/RagB family nutrient-binding outer membrane lipoprotein [Saprospiraceae bacterium]